MQFTCMRLFAINFFRYNVVSTVFDEDKRDETRTDVQQWWR